MLQILASPTAQQIGVRAVRGLAVVAIDVLRAATTAARALELGASAVWAVEGVEEAFARRRALGKAVLGGERGMHSVAGFDAGNSPEDYSAALLAGRPLVLTTTNGTLALQRARGASHLAFAALTSAPLAVRWLQEIAAETVVLALAGTGGGFSFEDALCAGAIAAALEGAELDDLSRTCLAAFRGSEGTLLAALEATPHGQRLAAAGYGRDLAFASRIGAASALPVRDAHEKGRLVAWRGA